MFQLEACSISEQHLNDIFDDEITKIKFLGLIDLQVSLHLKSSGNKERTHSLTTLIRSKNCRIETLCLSNNRIGVKGALVIS